YHYKQKDALWRAVAEYAFAQMEADWPTVRPHPGPLTDAEAVRAEFRSLLLFTVKHTAFHHFMLRENQGPSPRLTWLIDNI
ncbi:hypothetical protein, partial [Klebsiella pneumoniae]|uniref:hypothetical protein n=1 Tax=Klebsiella pneumoniae TaxID=573 RepID=UPI003009EFE2